MNIITSFFAVRALTNAINLGQSVQGSLADAPTESFASALAGLPAHVAHRQTEYIDCLVANVECAKVARVVAVVQDAPSHRLLHEVVLPRLGPAARRKLLPILFARAPEQPLYSDLFGMALRPMLLDPKAPCMVCNADIYVTDGFDVDRVTQLLDMARSGGIFDLAPPSGEDPAAGSATVKRHRCALALTRYENEAMEAPLIDDYRGSHDAFIVQPRDLTPQFLQGVAHPQNCYKAENIVIHELRQAGFAVRNPCLSVRIFHKHEADVRQWLPPVDEERYGRAYPEP